MVSGRKKMIGMIAAAAAVMIAVLLLAVCMGKGGKYPKAEEQDKDQISNVLPDGESGGNMDIDGNGRGDSQEVENRLRVSDDPDGGQSQAGGADFDELFGDDAVDDTKNADKNQNESAAADEPETSGKSGASDGSGAIDDPETMEEPEWGVLF